MQDEHCNLHIAREKRSPGTFNLQCSSCNLQFRNEWYWNYFRHRQRTASPLVVDPVTSNRIGINVLASDFVTVTTCL
ncbi:hypothetical protein LF1_24860 [Rubripirellula obstinata]|uniref:Uncharacterized protein n=1 Tax=Rubripirellula obstinata TaxID=406547 RepID=A0A5B1CFH0_9BACT|nr:hypothetical protein LF1_24860 [Rubripirellula obstinata]